MSPRTSESRVELAIMPSRPLAVTGISVDDREIKSVLFSSAGGGPGNHDISVAAPFAASAKAPILRLREKSPRYSAESPDGMLVRNPGFGPAGLTLRGPLATGG